MINFILLFRALRTIYRKTGLGPVVACSVTIV